MKRRAFLKGAGALTVLIAGGGVWRAYDQGIFSTGEGPAYEPWLTWETDANQGPLALVRAAILAANPHNTQPWLFRVTDQYIDVYADTVRNLGSFDPYLREMHLGLGCALENMILAASANGYEAAVTLFEGTLGPIPTIPEPVRIARVNIALGEEERSHLYEAIPKRHTHRGAYVANQALSQESIRAIHQLAASEAEVAVFLFTSEADKVMFSNAVVRATETIISDATMVKDSERWFRHSWADIQKYRDGPTLDTAGLPRLRTTIAKMLPPTSAETNHRFWLEATRDVHVVTASMFGLIAVRKLYDRAQTLRAGRVWQRIHLWATSQGIAMQPLNQPIERVDRERELNKSPHAAQVLANLTRDPSWQPTFAFRAGYPEREALPSPRRAVEQVLH